MQILKAFFKIFKSKIPLALVYVVVFLVITVLMANTGANDDTFTQMKLNLAIIDLDGTEASKSIKTYLEKGNVPVGLENDKEEILNALFNQRINYALVIKEGYEQNLRDGKTDGLFENYQSPNTSAGVVMDNKINQYVKLVSAYMAGGQDFENAVSKTGKVLDEGVEVKIESFSKKQSSDFPSLLMFYYQYLPYIFISIVITLLCPVLLVMNKKEIKDRTNCSSIKFSSQTMQIAFGSILSCILIWIVFIGASVIIIKPEFSDKFYLAVLNSFVFMLISFAMALIISNFAKNEDSLGLIANILGLGMSFLTGIFVPQSMLGDGVLAVAKFLPSYWYVRANNMIAGLDPKKYEVSAFMEFILIELVFAVVLFIASVVVSRVKKTKN